MESLFKKYKNILVVHDNYQGHVCGYTDSHLILAVETKDNKNFWRNLQNAYIADEYKDAKYRYIYEDERQLIAQSRNVRQK
jgi:hypothetical protein